VGVVAALWIRAEDAGGESEDPGSAPPRAPRLRAVGSTRPGDADAGTPRILLVEDDPSMRMLCRLNLELNGFEVVEAATGAEGLAKADSGPFDLILLDVMLPDTGGVEIAERLAGTPAQSTPVVFVSARGADGDIARGFDAGAIDYIVKPFDVVQLSARLREDLDELARSGREGLRRRRFGREES
jgi:DNA-binding response OmpR family regulator